GYAWQKGLVPVSLDALMTAIQLNGTAVAMNETAFNWGRLAAHDPAAVAAALGPAPAVVADETLDALIARRIALLTAYQDAAYAERYRALVDRARAAEAACLPGRADFAEAVARGAAKLMAYKDEYEVARLYT
ncbi:2-oxoacid ferredoxin oxidoreductase, partial [Mycobacterium tuberculosis]|nr:2-oxoacid ferredoxin oxidoreductase [Mycobacterium tuberculosis]